MLARHHVDQGTEFPWDVGARGEHPVSLHHSLVEGCSQFFWNLQPVTGRIKTLGSRKPLRQENAKGGSGWPAGLPALVNVRDTAAIAVTASGSTVAGRSEPPSCSPTSLVAIGPSPFLGCGQKLTLPSLQRCPEKFFLQALLRTDS